MMRSLRFVAVVCFLTFLSLAQVSRAQSPEEKTAKYLDSVRHQPGLLLAFLQQMPKGGDLHVHLSGAIYAESFIDWASENALCVDRSTSKLIHASCDSCEPYKVKPSVRCAYQDHILYDQLVDAWSMRNWHREEESGHDHFFATFEKFGPAMEKHVGDAFAEVASRAAADHLQYVEVMHTADGAQAAVLGTKIGWDDDFSKLRDKLLAGGMADIVASVRSLLDSDEARKKEVMHCGTAQAAPGCEVTIHYLYQVLRGLPREQVFAQILLGFELTKADPRFVGFNLVMPEDYYVPMHDFDLHMRIIEALHKFYPATHVSLHADELAMGLVPPEGLRFHIRESIERGGAERIGHGVAVMSEDDPIGLLREMAKKNVLVEICLTSNDVILGVSGDRHPLPLYMKYGVPVALATDDEGVSRSDMTHEYLRAVETYGLSYAELKRMARASLEHSFIPGDSLWSDGRELRRTAACEDDKESGDRVSEKCQKWLAANERARVQWYLEKAFAEFEKKF
ncbi:Adenosine deaminase [Candidatus Sulfotelmatobacter sp. SbA7]|nr:Adenosine deaminase [Candidatus Sulfotelmatobacter sp. SbA7]